jgi:ketosteroid isomerase-like protein
MRQIRSLLPLAVFAIVGCAGMGQKEPAAPAVDQAAISAQIDSLNAAYMAAVTARDTSAIALMYADDAHLMAQGMPMMTGPGEIRRGWSGFLATPGLDLKTQSTKKMVSQAGDMVVDIGTYQQKMQDAKGATIEDVGKYVTIFRKTDAGWKIVVDTFNSDKGMM